MLNIIVVDDEVPIREWIVFSIDKQNKPFNIVGVASSGQEAYELALKHKPDVIVTDIKMPGMDGLELMQAVKKVLPYTAFVILTNYADFAYAKQAITYGARDYLLKSEMRGEDLGEALDKILQEKESITTQKEMDILKSGYIDLYSLYNEFDQEAYSKKFWSKYQMQDDTFYQVMALHEEREYSQREFLKQVLQEAQVSFYVMAVRHGIIYVIFQEKSPEKLDAQMIEVMQSIYSKTHKVIARGSMYKQLKDSIDAIEEAEQALGYTFFEETCECLSYIQLCQATRLNRTAIRATYHEILGQIALKLYDEAKKRLGEWFRCMQKVHIEDAGWAKEICQRMMISIEERFYQLNIGLEERSVTMVVPNIEAMYKECEKMISKMIPNEISGGIKPMDKALHFIHDKYNHNISLAEVAQEVFLSPEYFSRLFKEEIGENFSVYLMLYRLKRAKELLITTDMRIAEIAHEVGYGTPGYFTRIYKKYMGRTPEAERNNK